ncbi:MAG: 50S ribosomal protein L13 [Puniceicoccales bacterium]|jgi:large subunit ribosomal protein L13|nr:50S ribosomal protein L13 [Puniceicoccales bacterium]
MKTTLAKKENVQRRWHLVDAKGEILGKLAVKVANLIRGRHKISYTPHVDGGDFVVVINAGEVAVTGKKETQKSYVSYAGYRGGQKIRPLAQVRQKNPSFIVQHAVKGMLPKNRLADQMLKKLKVYAGPEHPHQAQNLLPYKI